MFRCLTRSTLHGIACYIGDAARQSAQRVRMHIRIGARNIHVFVRQAELFGGNLAQHRECALADLAFATDNGGAAVVIDAHYRRTAIPVAETAAAIHMQTASHAQATIWFLIFVLGFPADQRRRFVDALLQLATGDLVVVWRYVTRLNRVHAQ